MALYPFPSKQQEKELRQKWYQFVAREWGIANLYFMNYGYNYFDPPSSPILLDPSEENVRLQIQLYHYVTRINVEGRNVLEIGCGGGAGASYVSRQLKPKTYTALDFSLEAIRSCKQNQKSAGLTLVAGDAESLPFRNQSFDVVINVESCHCYISLGNFIDSVRRVLVPGGYFVLVDIRAAHILDTLQQAISNSGMTVVEDQLITKNVVEAMMMQERMKEEFLTTVPEHLKTPIREFIGGKGSEIHEGLKRGTFVYVSYLLQKS